MNEEEDRPQDEGREDVQEALRWLGEGATHPGDKEEGKMDR